MFFRTTARMEEAAPAADASMVSVPVEAKPELPTTKSFKVNGKMVEVPLDKLDSYAQLGLASTAKFEEAKKLREEAQSILDVAKTEKSAMKSLLSAGFSREEAVTILEADLRKEYEEEDLSPEQKQAREKDARLAKFETEEKARQTKIEQEASSKEEQDELEKIDKEIADAIEESDLPKNPILGKWALQYMSSFADQGEELSAKEAMKLVNSDMKEIIRDMLSNMDASAVKQFLKSDQIKGLQNDVVKEYQSKQSAFSKPATAPKQVDNDSTGKVSHGTIKGRDFWDKKRSF